MVDMLENLAVKDWLELNAKLQQKKNALRAELAERGVLVRKGSNDYDKYKYFSEAQYKELFTELMSKHKLELKFYELEYDTFECAGKNSNGRLTKLEFYLFDTETGFYEKSAITGEGADKGDKGGYKAYTGALKYYLADTFMVATGDDAEKDSPAEKMNKKQSKEVDMSGTIADTPSAVSNLKGMIKTLESMGATAFMDELRQVYNIERVEDIKKVDYRPIVRLAEEKYELLKEVK